MDAIITELQADFGRRYGTPITETVEAGRVRDFLLALDEDNPTADSVPALFLLTLGRTRRPDPARGSAVNAGDEYEFLAPVHVGDRITVERSLLGIDEKQGRHGRMFLSRVRIRYTNQHGVLVARARQDTLRWGLG